ncbi:MAG: hypothetical protein K1X89_09495 [Myxococcaceae bacterium]|nr:hypothetical protein [Myxococcaceae bacterium]
MRATLGSLAVLAVAACTPGQGGQDAGTPHVYATALPDGGTATWYRDVAPLAQKHCQGCHNAGSIAPFSVETFQGVKGWHTAIGNAVSEQRMPPWMPSAACGQKYRDDRRMSLDEADVFTAWAAGGGLEGDVKDAPPAYVAQQGLEWTDLSIAPKAAYTPNNTRPDDYHCFLIDPNVTQTKDVVGFEVVPGVRAEVHHVLLYAVDRAEAQKADDAEPGEGWTCFGGPGSNNPILIGGWVPGTAAVRYPTGVGIPLPAGKVFAMQIHYNTAQVREPDLTSVKLQYAKGAVTQALLIPLADPFFSVPPHAMDWTPAYHPVSTPNQVGADLRAWGVFPHMHTKGKRITVTGPDGCMVDIPKWDFQWQQQYFFDQPRRIKKGEAVKLGCTWDNPGDKPVGWGEGTADEMCLAYLLLSL